MWSIIWKIAYPLRKCNIVVKSHDPIHNAMQSVFSVRCELWFMFIELLICTLLYFTLDNLSPTSVLFNAQCWICIAMQSYRTRLDAPLASSVTGICAAPSNSYQFDPRVDLIGRRVPRRVTHRLLLYVGRQYIDSVAGTTRGRWRHCIRGRRAQFNCLYRIHIRRHAIALNGHRGMDPQNNWPTHRTLDNNNNGCKWSSKKSMTN